MHGRVPVKKLNMDARKGVVVTAPGDSDPQVPATGREQAVCPGSSSSDRKNKALAVGKQAPGGGNCKIATNTTVGGCAPQAPTGSLTAADITARKQGASVFEDLPRSKVMAALMACSKPRASVGQNAPSSPSVYATPTGGAKRKAGSPPSKGQADEDVEMAEAFRKVWKAYENLAFEVESEMDGDENPLLIVALGDLRDSLAQVITSKGELRSPSQKRAKPEDEPCVPRVRAETCDASTDTPCWWSQVDMEGPSPPSANKAGHSEPRAKSGKGVVPGPMKKNRRQRRVTDAGTTPVDGAPPPAVETRTTTVHTDSSEWTTVGHKKKRGAAKVPSEPRRRVTPSAAALVKRRTPATEAVTIDKPREGKTFVEVMKNVTSKVDLKELGVEVVNTRVSKAGAIVLELKAKEEADKLAASIAAVIGEDAKVSRPTRRTPVLILDIPAWMSPEEVSREIIKSDPDIVGTKVAVRDNLGGGRVARLDIPMAAATRMAQSRVVQVGWTRCRIKLLEKKEARCYRCQGTGHVAAKCTAPERPKRCYGCNLAGHVAKDCPRKKKAEQGPPAQEAAEDMLT